MQINKVFFSVFWIFAFGYAINAKEYQWGKDYKVYIKPISNFVSELKIVETKNNKVLHESLTAMNYVIKTKQKKIDGKNVFFVQATTGGEGMVSSNLHYFYLENNDLKQGVVEDIIEFSLRNLDKDKNKELILTDFKYYKFKINNCYDALKPDPHFTGKLLPTIFKFRKDKFVEEKQNVEYLKKYFRLLERKLLKKKKFKNVKGYSHFFAISKRIGMEENALNYFKNHNSNFKFSCENTKKQNPNGKSFQLKMDYFSFFKKYGNKLSN